MQKKNTDVILNYNIVIHKVKMSVQNSVFNLKCT